MFEQYCVDGLSDTGGILWLTEQVLAEYVASLAMHLDLFPRAHASNEPMNVFDEAEFASSGSSGKGTVLVLGCGSSPLSGLVACSFGWNVVLTDLGAVVPQAQRNVARNLPALQAACQSALPSISVRHLPWGDADMLAAALDDREVGPLLVLCSDCVVKRSWHAILLETIALALCCTAPGCGAAFVAWEQRDPFVEDAFVKRAQSDAFGFDVSRLAVEDAVHRVPWSPSIRERLLSNSSDYERFLLYRLTVPANPGAAMAERRLWWCYSEGSDNSATEDSAERMV